MSANTNQDAPTRTIPIPPAGSALMQQIAADYPFDAPHTYLIHYTANDKPIDVKEYIHDLPGFKETVKSQFFLELCAVTVRWVPDSKECTIEGAISANKDMKSVHTCKTMFSQRATDLILGTHTFSLPLHTGLSRMLRPQNLSAFYPAIFIKTNAKSANVTIELSYKHGGGSISVATANS